VYQRGTVTRFKNPARHMYQRWWPCPHRQIPLRQKGRIND